MFAAFGCWYDVPVNFFFFLIFFGPFSGESVLTTLLILRHALGA